MHTNLSRWLLFGLLIGWSLSHAQLFAQPARSTTGDKIRQGLDKVITVDYTGQSLSDAINHLREKTGLRINIDQFAIMQTGINPDDNIGQVAVKGNADKASQVLRRLLNPYQLTYIVSEDALLVTTEEMAIHRQFRQRVSVDLEEISFSKAVRELAKSHGINLVIDPAIANETSAKVSLQLDNTDLETTIRLLAEIVNLKAVPMGNVLFVCSESKAKKIRDEDRLQNDNPLNPGVPRAIGMNALMRAGGFGGGMNGVARGIAVPGVAAPAIDLPALPPVQVVDPAPGAPRGAVPPPPPDAPVQNTPPVRPPVDPFGNTPPAPPVIRPVGQPQPAPFPAPPPPQSPLR